MEDLEFIFEMPSDEELSNYIALKGEKGDKGDPTATIEINEVKTGEAGTEAIIENVGTDVNLKLNITIPRGEQGEKGDKGEAGEISDVVFNGKSLVENGVADVTELSELSELVNVYNGKNISAKTVEGACKITKISGVLQQTGTPTPDTPVEIEVVGDNVNLIKNFNDYSTYGITATNNADGSLSITGTSSASNTTNYLVAVKKILVENIKDRDYTFLFKRSNTKNSIYARVRKYDGTNKTQIAYIHLANKITTYTLNIKELIDDNTVWVEVDIVTFSSTEYNEKLYIQLKKSTVSTSYTNYGIGSIDVKIAGKNLIGVKDTSSSTNLGITAEYDSSTGIYTLNGTSTNAGYIKLYDVLEVSTYANLNTRNRTLMSKGDYTLSYKYVSGSKTTGTANIMIRDCDDSTTTPRFEINKIGIENKQLQFTVAEDYLTQKYIWFASGVTFTNFKFSIQLENGNGVTEHEPYKEGNKVIELPQGEFLASIGDVKDYIDNQGVLHKYIKKSIGSELGWRLGGTQSFEDSLVFYSTTKDAKFDNNLNNNIKSTHLKNGNPYSYNEEVIGIMSTGELGIRVKKSTVTTLEDFIKWLDENKVEIYYELDTPYTVDLDFNNIIPQYAEQTNIISNAELEVEFTNSPAIASVNETFDKIQNELFAESSDYDIIVDIKGTGDYTNLTEAVNNAIDGQSIFVKKGIYNNEVVNCTGKKLTIVGEDNTIIQNDYDDYTLPPLIIAKGIVKNLSLKQIGSNSATTIKSYAVHVENNELANNELKFTNCYFYSKTHASFGMGLRPNCKVIFKDCEFRSDHDTTPQGEHRGAFFVHTSNEQAYAGDSQNVIFDNCKLSTKYGSVIHYQSCLGTDNIANITYYNCNIYSDELGVSDGLITEDLYTNATEKNVFTSNKSGGNNYALLNKASKLYSFNEKMIGTWVDGKPLYEKTYYITTEGEDLTELDFEYITISRVSVITNHYVFPVVRYTSADDRVDVYISRNPKTVNVNMSSNWSSDFVGAYITLEYTKASDVANTIEE